MTTSPSEKRIVACRILSYAGWIDGSMQVAPKIALINHLNRPETLFRLVDVKLPEQTIRHPFFALTRSSTVAVIPVDAAEIPQPLRGKTSHKTSWLLHGAIVIEGILDLLDGVRVSDHLAHRTGFVALHDCTLYMPHKEAPTTIVPRVPFLALQTDRAIGASEIDGEHHFE